LVVRLHLREPCDPCRRWSTGGVLPTVSALVFLHRLDLGSPWALFPV